MKEKPNWPLNGFDILITSGPSRKTLYYQKTALDYKNEINTRCDTSCLSTQEAQEAANMALK